jgi:excisionase family DNA binding protein
MITETDPSRVQPSQGFAENTKDFVTRLLPESLSNRLLTVKEVAEQLGVCTAIVYRLCDRGDLRHCRVVTAIRIRPFDLAAYISALRTSDR